ncbi:uncharacterized protein ATC70_008141 [Mucor velutinosus]|uniref:Uncharacterized protein n=1 Tax=Mucor velutinosus TaxID=708070 RepID=A0AAN7I345_9FUNG|nr:hypothetical protein ATC70_008141 [Mucor velutinosus]
MNYRAYGDDLIMLGRLYGSELSVGESSVNVKENAGGLEASNEANNEANNNNDEEDGLFGSVDRAKKTTIELVTAIKDEFGNEVCKEVILEACKEVQLILYGKKRELKTSAMSVQEHRERIQSFSLANLDLRLRLTGTDPVQHCLQINRKIKSMTMARYLSQTATFVYLLRMNSIIRRAEKEANVRDFNEGLMEGLEFTKTQQLSKFKRKCRRVDELVEYFGQAGGCSLGMYIPIFTLENGGNDDWLELVNDLKRQTEFYVYCMTLTVDENGLPVS